MTRRDGFAVMDVSTSIHTDLKFRKVERLVPGSMPVAFMAYMATLGDSWRDARRVSVEDAWPGLVPLDPKVVEAMVKARLLKADGTIPDGVWADWFEAVVVRREAARERWRESQRRGRETQRVSRNGAG